MPLPIAERTASSMAEDEPRKKQHNLEAALLDPKRTQNIGSFFFFWLFQ
jgi:hypothetical protein